MDPNPMPPMPPKGRRGPLHLAADKLQDAVDALNNFLHRKLFGGPR